MTNQDLFNTVYRHLLTQGQKAFITLTHGSESCKYRTADGRKCAIGCLIPDNRYSPTLEGKRAYAEIVREAAGITHDQLDLASALQDVHDYHEPVEWKEQLAQVARRYNLLMPVIQEPIRTVPRTRLERLRSLSSNGSISIQTVARILDCPEASVRRDIFQLRQAGYVVTLERGQIRCDGLRKDLANG